MLFKEVVKIALEEILRELQPTSFPTWKSHARAALEYWGGDRDLRTLTRLEVQEWIYWRAKTGVKASTIGHEKCLLARLWRILEDRGLAEGIPYPLQRLRMPKKNTDKRKITLDVVEKLRESLSKDSWDIVHLTLLTLLRRLEVFRIKIDHVILTYVNEAVVGKLKIITSKTGKGRVIPLSQEALAIILSRIKYCKENNVTFLFGPQKENRAKVASNWAKTVWRKALLEIKEKGHFHGLRHLGAHTAWKNGAPIEAISKMLGHSTIAQTEHYIGVTDEYMELAAEAVANIFLPKEIIATKEVETKGSKSTAWIFDM